MVAILGSSWCSSTSTVVGVAFPGDRTSPSTAARRRARGSVLRLRRVPARPQLAAHSRGRARRPSWAPPDVLRRPARVRCHLGAVRAVTVARGPDRGAGAPGCVRRAAHAPQDRSPCCEPRSAGRSRGGRMDSGRAPRRPPRCSGRCSRPRRRHAVVACGILINVPVVAVGLFYVPRAERGRQVARALRLDRCRTHIPRHRRARGGGDDRPARTGRSACGDLDCDRRHLVYRIATVAPPHRQPAHST